MLQCRPSAGAGGNDGTRGVPPTLTRYLPRTFIPHSPFVVQYLHDLIVARPSILAFWIFVIGAAIGSFLNVVVYRLPRGQSLSKPGSRCPRCGHAIRWYHNLPIVGWLLLGGKCYDCKQPISPRYPLVEFAVAAIFVALAYYDVYVPIVEAGTAPDDTPSSASLSLLLIAWGAHVWLACIVLAAALIRWDGHRVPWRLAIIAAFVAGASAPFLEAWSSWIALVAAAAIFALTFVGRVRRSSE
jgi:leader peptidase (prepilin peptidase)/N-methyltransferase